MTFVLLPIALTSRLIAFFKLPSILLACRGKFDREGIILGSFESQLNDIDQVGRELPDRSWVRMKE